MKNWIRWETHKKDNHESQNQMNKKRTSRQNVGQKVKESTKFDAKIVTEHTLENQEKRSKGDVCQAISKRLKQQKFHQPSRIDLNLVSFVNNSLFSSFVVLQESKGK